MNQLQKKVITLLDAITKDIVLNAQIETELTEASLASLNNLRLLSSVPQSNSYTTGNPYGLIRG